MKKLSIIAPCYNEAKNITHFFKILDQTLKNIDYEIIFIDDGSDDNTLSVLKNLYNKNQESVKIISFSRNFNKDAAIFAGLQKSCGLYTCIIDTDLQQHPKYILKMMNVLDNDITIDQVAMVNAKRKENFFIKIFKKLFYKLIDVLSDIKFVENASDFRMFRKEMLNAIISLKENNRFSKGIFSWVGFNTYYMPYEVENRLYGESKFKFKTSLKYALDGIFSFSVKPLRIATYTGLCASFIAFLLLIEVIVEKIFFNHPVAGYPTIMCTILFLGGIQLITIGILGEYLSKTFLEVKKRPIYIIKEKYGFKNK